MPAARPRVLTPSRLPTRVLTPRGRAAAVGLGAVIAFTLLLLAWAVS